MPPPRPLPPRRTHLLTLTSPPSPTVAFIIAGLHRVTLLNHVLSVGAFLRNSRSSFVTDKNSLTDACGQSVGTDSLRAPCSWDHTRTPSKACLMREAALHPTTPAVEAKPCRTQKCAEKRNYGHRVQSRSRGGIVCQSQSCDLKQGHAKASCTHLFTFWSLKT